MSSPTGPWREALAFIDRFWSETPASQEKLLAELANDNPLVHAKVSALLDADEEATRTGFMRAQKISAAQLRAGQRLGAYEIVRKLGAGGMGEVWLAKRADGLYQGDVAIKTLHPHLANTALRERFAREVHILGKLTHKNIARLLDAGVSDDGIAYIVLEYVQGEPLDVWCDSRQLPIRARLELYLSVCAAVAHAHTHLVVHRDIKPANILVNEFGSVKLLDFGVAKLVHGDPHVAEPTALTQFGGRIFTPEYAAPEQITGQGVTTATDVYALGVVLHMLLSGKRPFGETGATGHELEQAILNAEPFALALLPSDSADAIAKNRATTPAKLERALRGDLEHIVNRALRKAPKDRYGSALALAVDIERYFQQQPIEAREGSGGYRLTRFVQRHRAGTVAAFVSIVALVSGATAAIWQAREANTQAARARVEAQKANAVKAFLLDIFNTNSTSHPDGADARATTAEELVDVASESILTKVNEDPEARLELMDVLGAINQQLEKFDRTEALQMERLRFAQEKFGKDDSRAIQAHLDLAEYMRTRGKLELSVEHSNEAIASMERLGDRSSIQRGLAEIELGQAAYASGNGKDKNPVGHFLAAIEILEKLPPSKELVRAHLGLARAYEPLGNFEAAIAANTRGIELAIKVLGPKATTVAGGHQQLSRALLATHRLAEAEQHLNEAIEIFTFIAGPTSGFTTGARLDLGRMLIRRGKYREAVEVLEQVLAQSIKTNGPANGQVQNARYTLARSFYSIGDYARASRLIGEMLDVVKNGSNPTLHILGLWLRAQLAIGENRAGEALPDLEQAWKVIQENDFGETFRATTVLSARAEAMAQLRRFTEARASIASAKALLDKVDTDPTRTIGLELSIVEAQTDLADGKVGDADRTIQRKLDAVANESRRAELWAWEEWAERVRAEISLQQGKREEACRALSSAIALRKANALATDPRLVRTREHHKKYCATE